MRITRETLLKIARETATQRVRTNRHLLCIYLTGSLLGDEALLGGTADIDLVFVHDSMPLQEREVVRVSDDVHLDIAHHAQSVYHQPRNLRKNPWIGSYLCNSPLALHDMQHWFEFTQASVSAQFDLPVNVLERARPLADSARQTWFELQAGECLADPHTVWAYIKALENVANAIACLSGPPLTERRFLLNFPQRAEAIDRPGLASGLIDLFTERQPDVHEWEQWLGAWRETFSSASQRDEAPASLHPCRRSYYERAIHTLKEDHPQAALWLLARTWTRALTCLEEENEHLAAWKELTLALGLGDEQLEARLEQFDAYLDTVEETLDQWAKSNGI